MLHIRRTVACSALQLQVSLACMSEVVRFFATYRSPQHAYNMRQLVCACACSQLNYGALLQISEGALAVWVFLHPVIVKKADECTWMRI